MTDDVCIQIKTPQGHIGAISPQEFRRQFAVEYTSRLLFTEGLNSFTCTTLEKSSSEPVFWQHLSSHLFGRARREFQRAVRNGLCAQQVLSGHTANLYLAKINDVVGTGTFAGEDIREGELVGEYTGIVRPSRTESGNLYVFHYDGDLHVDAQERGNYTRFINHSARRNNVTPIYIFVESVLHILLVAISPIVTGQQVLMDYGRGVLAKRPATTRTYLVKSESGAAQSALLISAATRE